MSFSRQELARSKKASPEPKDEATELWEKSQKLVNKALPLNMLKKVAKEISSSPRLRVGGSDVKQA